MVCKQRLLMYYRRHSNYPKITNRFRELRKIFLTPSKDVAKKLMFLIMNDLFSMTGISNQSVKIWIHHCVNCVSLRVQSKVLPKQSLHLKLSLGNKAKVLKNLFKAAVEWFICFVLSLFSLIWKSKYIFYFFFCFLDLICSIDS